MKDIKDYIKECWKDTKGKAEHNKEYYRGCHDAYTHLLRYLGEKI